MSLIFYFNDLLENKVIVAKNLTKNKLAEFAKES